MIKTLKDFSLIGKRVLVRCDFNVPVDAKGNILDDFRIRQTLPTIKFLIETKAKVILMAHLDPESTNVVDVKYNLDKVAEKLASYLKLPIAKEEDCIGPEVEDSVNTLEPGKVLLLENLRFHKEETEGDEEFAKQVSYLGDIYVNDAFGVSHRNHASITLVPQFLPHCSGLLLEKEITSLNKIIKNPDRPMIAIIGGKKAGTKAQFIEKMAAVSDFVIISGLIAKEVAEKNIPFEHPEKIIAPFGNLGAPDIDEKSIEAFCQKIVDAKSILWNGPFGKFEEKKYAKGTLAIANAIIQSGAFSVVGGGETVEFLAKHGIIDKFSHISTGGAAMMAYLSGEGLPGLEVLKD